MHEKGRLLIKKLMKKRKLIGPDIDCKYFPCHKHLEDCSFCFCPFYPCYRSDTGGLEKISSRTGKPVWDCSDCVLNHDRKNAEKILEGLLRFDDDFDKITRKQLFEILDNIIHSGEN